MYNALLQYIYMQGHIGRPCPRLIRRFFAGITLHRAWVLGSKGYFIQDGVSYGPTNPYGLKITKPDTLDGTPRPS